MLKNMSPAMLLTLLISTANATGSGGSDAATKPTFFTPFGITIIVIAVL